jgi:hypothetical protein
MFLSKCQNFFAPTLTAFWGLFGVAFSSIAHSGAFGLRVTKEAFPYCHLLHFNMFLLKCQNREQQIPLSQHDFFSRYIIAKYTVMLSEQNSFQEKRS